MNTDSSTLLDQREAKASGPLGILSVEQQVKGGNRDLTPTSPNHVIRYRLRDRLRPLLLALHPRR